ncbi:Floricaula/leafy protein [Dioscorea alata]|uniref:Floricaula/leafy protein n=1 Tax=Dioscorea alata TaxID=55571 RepID=A0ACB7V938_DIOAL|nr:Floricaula/leafy protein [Dioscorea alata]
MDPGDAFSANKFRWDPRPAAPPPQHHHEPAERARELEEVFEGYGVRGATVARMGELGFTASTLAGMREEEVDDMMAALAHLFRWDLLVGERYGIKAALRAERRRLDSLRLQQGLQFQHQHLAGVAAGSRPLLLLSPDHPHNLDALSQEGLSEEPVQQEREAAGSGGEGGGRRVSNKGKQQQHHQHMKGSSSSKRSKKKKPHGGEDHLSDSDSESEGSGGGFGCAVGERQREHPFIVTEPGEVARAKKNGLDYLFHLYDQCRDFLLQVQAIAKERGDKCPTKVTNQVFRYAKKAGASYINKPKMRHYVHCYALHCLEEEVSNALRRAYKERGENVGAWRQACYKPLVAIAARHGWDIDAVFNAHPRLAIWYVPTKLRQLCHLARSQAAAAAAAAGGTGLGSASASCLPVPPPPPPPPPPMY